MSSVYRKPSGVYYYSRLLPDGTPAFPNLSGGFDKPYNMPHRWVRTAEVLKLMPERVRARGNEDGEQGYFHLFNP